MKKCYLVILIVVLCFQTLSLSAQNYVYSYDACGNRVLRSVPVVKKDFKIDSVFEETDTLLLGVDISVFPNPAEDFLNVEIQGGVNEIKSIQLFDSAGRKVDELSTVFGMNVFRVMNLKPGNYIVVVVGEEGKESIQVLVK